MVTSGLKGADVKQVTVLCLASILLLSLSQTTSAQLLAAKDGPIVYGHHHIAASDIPAHLTFFADTLGGTRMTFGPQKADVVKFPNVFIFFRNQKPTGGSKGTTVNHVGFSVTNLRQTLDRVKAAGYPIITRSEVAATQQVIDDIAPVNATTSIAFVMGPDDVKVELLENTQQSAPIALHHVHSSAHRTPRCARGTRRSSARSRGLPAVRSSSLISRAWR